MSTPMELDDHDVDDQIRAILQPTADTASTIEAMRSLADRSREDLAVRSSLGQIKVLQGLTEHIQALPTDQYDLDYEQETLRCIGNACAMNRDAIRAISTLGFEWFKRYTTTKCPSKLQDLATAVLFNISAADFSAEGDDQEQENPALKACYAAGIHIWLIKILIEPQSTSLGTEDLIDMLFWISSSTPAAAEQTLPENTMLQLLNNMHHFCSDTPPEALGTLIESIVTLLRPVKTQLAQRSDTNGLFVFLEALEQRLAAMRIEPESGDLPVLLPQASNLTWLLSDVSAEPAFATRSGLDDALLRSCLVILTQPIGGAPSDQLRIASSLVMGNALLNLPEGETTTLVQTTALLTVLVELLSQPSASADLLHAASGLLTVLCRPKETRERIGAMHTVIGIVGRLCKHEVPQIREAGVRLLKALGRNSPRNQERLAAVAQALSSSQAGQQQLDAP